MYNKEPSRRILGGVEKSEDINANTRDLEAERKAYEHAKGLKRERHKHD
jgi:hypothetical protein